MGDKKESLNYLLNKNEDVYLVMLKYFNGDPLQIDKVTVNEFKNDKYRGKLIRAIDPSIIKKLNSIRRHEKSHNMTYTYPEWKDDPEIVKEKLDEMFPPKKKEQKVKKDGSELPVVDKWEEMPSDDHGDESVKKPVKKAEKKPVKDAEDITYIAEHVKWKDNLKFYPNKNFKRVKNGDKGIWELEDNVLTLNWNEWEPEVFHTEDNGQTFIHDNGSILTLQKYTIIPKWFKLTIEIPEEKKELPVKEKIKPTDLKNKDNYKYILEQRKSYVDWINNEFYDKIIGESDDPKIKNNYQLFVKGYLSLESPFRGLLVYHGLGTGKTATSVITAEGLSPMKVNTLLPASLRGNFIAEIKKFATDTFNIELNNWVFYTLDEINKDDTIREYLFIDLGLEKSLIDTIYRRTNLILKKEGKIKPKVNTKDNFSKGMKVSFISKNKEFYGTIKEVDKNNKKRFIISLNDDQEASVPKKKLKIIDDEGIESDSLKKGLFVNMNFIKHTDNTLYTIDGELKINKHIKLQSYKNIEKLSDIQLTQLNIQIDFMIENKYNFIHYNGWSIDKGQIKDIKVDDEGDIDLFKHMLVDDDEGPTGNNIVIHKLFSKLEENKKLNIFSPFTNEVIIIDEVHNLISQIKNNRGPATLFYNWIVNSKDVKIVFLSGTPTINEPSEIAYLFNMLKGRIDIFDFSIKMDADIDDVSKSLKDIFYDKMSSIEQLYVRKIKGNIVVSFIKIRSNFANILDEDGNVKTMKFNNYSFEDFIKQIFVGLHNFCDNESIDKKLITPSEKEYNNLPKKDKNYLLKGKPHIFDTYLDITFNRQQKLFELYDDNNNKTDLSNNTEFMEYFFDENGNIQPRKQVLLRRMLMGLTSYYPIDRSAISYMPEIVKPTIEYPKYRDFNITKKINIVPCFMSYEQFSRYESKYAQEQKQSLNRKSMYEDSTFHYYAKTRQSCNIVYNQDITQEHSVDPTRLYEGMNEKENFSTNLINYSPKMLNIFKNMHKFINKSTGHPTGKILIYSDYKNLGGTGAFEQVLIANGYERYDHKSNPIENLIKTDNRKKRYTFITGDANENKEINKNAFNVEQNKEGEFIQVMMISESGAEGISLTCVRQVHIINPFWNNVRIDQVFGRAIRRNSHMQLDESDRNVEQYLYLALFPEGNTIKDIFSSIKNLGWQITNDIDLQDNFEQYLLDNNKPVYTMVQKILHVKNMSQDTTTDQMIFKIMEKKYNITEKLNNIIKESSVDCLKHTTDDPILNNKCIQFSSKLQNEISYFPGIDSNELNKVDTIQLKSTKSYFIQPDTIVVAGKNMSSANIFSYYKIDERYKDEDMRYIKENGVILCDFFLDKNKFLTYEPAKFPLNDKITNKFSVVQSIYHVDSDDPIYTENIDKDKFPKLSDVRKKKYLVGYKIKYNINDRLFFMPVNIHDLDVYKLYDYKSYLEQEYSIGNLPCFVLYKNKFYQSI